MSALKNLKPNFGKLVELASPVPKAYLFSSVLGGGLLGAVASGVTNILLLQIGINPLFTTYFGIIFILIGSFMWLRAKHLYQEEIITDNEASFMREEKNIFLKYAAQIVILSGFICFFLETKWTHHHKYLFKICEFILVSMSLNYAVVFGLLDFVNFLLTKFRSENSLEIIGTKDQILSCMACCFFSGGLYGLIFSFLDVEDSMYYGRDLATELFYEERLCLPLGFICGVVGGFANEILRHNHGRYQSVVSNQEDPFDEEI